MNPLNQINSWINALTSDEDRRQDLWAHYLEERSANSLASYLNKLEADSRIENEFLTQLWYVLNNPPSDKFTELLGKLSEIEQSIACLLALGLTVQQLSKYKGMSEIRIRQVISVMRDNDCWEEFYAEEKADRGRALRSERRRNQTSRKVSEKK